MIYSDKIMPRFMIILPHENSKKACEQALRILKLTGSHFLTHADFGCPDDVHMAWLNIEVDTKEDAMRVVPAFYQHSAKVIELDRFTLDNPNHLLKPRRNKRID